jgi:ketosteroid isomerase-like protein
MSANPEIPMRLLLAMLLCATSLDAGAQATTGLHDEITRIDRKFFDAFNSCDLKTMGELFSDDLEFYHDLGGVNDHAGTMDATRRNCEKGLGLRRTLVDGSLEIHPIGDYGALQKGRHTFCHLENGKNDCGTFEFVHVWKRTEDGWKLTRVISYGH